MILFNTFFGLQLRQGLANSVSGRPSVLELSSSILKCDLNNPCFDFFPYTELSIALTTHKTKH